MTILCSPKMMIFNIVEGVMTLVFSDLWETPPYTLKELIRNLEDTQNKLVSDSLTCGERGDADETCIKLQRIEQALVVIYDYCRKTQPSLIYESF